MIIYVANKIERFVPLVTQMTEVGDPEVEAIWLKISIGTLVFIIGGIYRPPSADHRIQHVDTRLLQMIDTVYQLDIPTLVFGDFNLPTMAWEELGATPKTETDHEYINLFAKLNLTQVVLKPTRYRDNQTPSISDLILTNYKDIITPIQFRPPIGKSDHLALTTELQANLIPP